MLFRSMITAFKLAEQFREQGKKVIIWNSFIGNMNVFKTHLFKNYDPIMINGSVPKDISIPGNRDELINKFKNSKSAEILIATAASMGESVSLHKNLNNEKVCEHAIYLDRNFNAGQYMQSMDRIHRIGMDPNSHVQYHLINRKSTRLNSSH